MNREIPSSSKKLSKLWIKKNLSLHQSNIRNAKSRVDLRSPNKFTHLEFKAKNIFMQEERYTEIERENRILLNKMTSMSTNYQYKSNPLFSKSLNKDARKRKLEKIYVENKALMKRISEKRSNYNISVWETQRKGVEKLLDNICEYPYALGSQRFFKSNSKSFKYKAVESPKTAQGFRKSPSKDILLAKTVMVSGIKFLVKITRLIRGYQINAYKKDSTESYSFDVGNEEALEIMGGTEDFQKLVSALKMDGEDMILVEYRE